MDLQLWSMDEYKDMISILAHNEFGSLMICFYPYFRKCMCYSYNCYYTYVYTYVISRYYGVAEHSAR